MRLTKLCAGIALWLALGTAASAGAASTVALNLQLESGFGPTAVWGLYVQNSLGIALGAVDVLVEGATGFSFNASLPGISLADSVYSVRPISGSPWDALIINNTALGVTLIPAGATTRLGAFLPGDSPDLLPGETPDPTGPGTVLGGTIFDVNLHAIVPLRIDRTGSCGPETCFPNSGLLFTVPEPAVPLTVLVPAVLVALAFTRRVASCA